VVRESTGPKLNGWGNFNRESRIQKTWGANKKALAYADTAVREERKPGFIRNELALGLKEDGQAGKAEVPQKGNVEFPF